MTEIKGKRSNDDCYITKMDVIVLSVLVISNWNEMRINGDSRIKSNRMVVF